jgi:hypothetical protein
MTRIEDAAVWIFALGGGCRGEDVDRWIVVDACG